MMVRSTGGVGGAYVCYRSNGVLVECKHCGAPLDVRESQRYARCRYCGSVDERANLRTVSVSTPSDFRPPPRWTPPEHVPADSAVDLPYRESRAGLVAGIVAPLVLLGAAALFVNQSGKPGAFIVIPTAIGGRQLMALSLDQSPAALAAALSTSPTDKSIFVKLDSARFQQLTFSYSDGHLDHPTSFYFGAVEGGHFDAAVRAALEKQLTTALNENGWRWEHVWLNIDSKTGSIGGNIEGEGGDNPLWKRQLDALFRVVVSASFGELSVLSDADGRELLGTGYEFSSLAELDPKTPVESARDVIATRFPGSVFSDSGGFGAHVALAHPLFTHVELGWNNAAAAPIYEVGFRPRGGVEGYEARREAVAACVTQAFGKPEVHVTDYLKGTKYYYYEVANSRIYLQPTYLYFFADKPMEAALWRKIFGTLGACK
jgi:hypothetical protein